MDRVDGALLEASPNLKVISQMAAGLDNVELIKATKRGIPVGYTPGIVSEATADQAFALLLAAARRVGESERWVRQGRWQIAFHPLFWLGHEVNHATLGIVGMGKIGMEMAKRARGFDMKVLYHSRSPHPEAEELYQAIYADLPTLLRSSDFVSLHVPLTAGTRHLIGPEELSLMKPTAILVNAARGPVVDSHALYQALRNGTIAGAALDVTEPEPIPPDDPLLNLENLVVVPHLGSATVATRTRMALLAAQNLVAGLRGERLAHCANPDVYA
jgi:lactate dehydrogenase-like 2-hydroxyacid dehydrogenase